MTDKVNKVRTKVFKISPQKLLREAVRAAAEVVRQGGVIIFPTDTIYGMGCGLFHRQAVHRIYALKGRGHSKPFPILIHDPREVKVLAREIPEEAGILMKRFWPGPLTLVFRSSLVARLATGGRDTVAVRLPKDTFIRNVMKSCGLPLASTSANLSGHPALSSAQEVIRQFKGRVEAIVDGGPTKLGVPSTVLDVSAFPFTVRRQGAVPKAKLLKILNNR